MKIFQKVLGGTTFFETPELEKHDLDFVSMLISSSNWSRAVKCQSWDPSRLQIAGMATCHVKCQGHRSRFMTFVQQRERRFNSAVSTKIHIYNCWQGMQKMVKCTTSWDRMAFLKCDRQLISYMVKWTDKSYYKTQFIGAAHEAQLSILVVILSGN